MPTTPAWVANDHSRSKNGNASQLFSCAACAQRKTFLAGDPLTGTAVVVAAITVRHLEAAPFGKSGADDWKRQQSGMQAMAMVMAGLLSLRPEGNNILLKTPFTLGKG